MFRPSRRLIAALLWLAIALLPLRGVAGTLMPANAMPLHLGTMATEAAAPCHGSEAALDAADASHADGSHAGCSLCDLCHGTVLSADLPGLHWDAPPRFDAPAHRAAALEPRAPDGLFRPPRTDLV